MSVDLVATFVVRAGEEEKAAGLLAAYARVVRDDPGTVLFEPATLRDSGTHFHVFERYLDEAAFAGHIEASANAEFNAALGPLLVGEVELQFLSPLLTVDP